MLFALVMLSSCNNMGNKPSNDVASLFEKYKHMEGVIYDKQAKASSELLVGPAVRIEYSQYINRAWSDSSVVNKKKR